MKPHCFILIEACSCRLEMAYFAGKISTNRLVCKNAVTLTYYGSCRLLVMGSCRDSVQSQNEDNFPTFSLEAEKEKNNGKGDSASAPSRFASLSECKAQQILTDRHSGKTKQMANWSVSIFKGRLKFFCFKVLKLELSTENLK